MSTVEYDYNVVYENGGLKSQRKSHNCHCTYITETHTKSRMRWKPISCTYFCYSWFISQCSQWLSLHNVKWRDHQRIIKWQMCWRPQKSHEMPVRMSGLWIEIWIKSKGANHSPLCLDFMLWRETMYLYIRNIFFTKSENITIPRSQVTIQYCRSTTISNCSEIYLIQYRCILWLLTCNKWWDDAVASTITFHGLENEYNLTLHSVHIKFINDHWTPSHKTYIYKNISKICFYHMTIR